jgi:hypothetical protein
VLHYEAKGFRGFNSATYCDDCYYLSKPGANKPASKKTYLESNSTINEKPVKSAPTHNI